MTKADLDCWLEAVSNTDTSEWQSPGIAAIPVANRAGYTKNLK